MTAKMHEVLAAEDTVVQASKKMVAETTAKFGKISELYTGLVRTLKRLKDSTEDKAIEQAARKAKELPTTVPETLDYIWPVIGKMLDLKLVKHQTNQKAMADVKLGDTVLIAAAPVDFLLDLERIIPEWRAMFLAMPTLDPSRQWTAEGRRGQWKSDGVDSAQTETVAFPVILHAGEPNGRPAQVKETSRVNTVGIFTDVTFSGAATTVQKAEALALCDQLLVAVRTARMRANTIEIAQPQKAGRTILAQFEAIFKN